MPAFTLPLQGGMALVEVGVGLHPSMARALARRGLPVPTPVHCQGLIDTGAAVTCIDPGVLHRLAVRPAGTVALAGIFGPALSPRCRRFRVALAVINPVTPGQDFSIPFLSIAEAPVALTGPDVLVGCDALARAAFLFDGRNASFTLSW